MFNLVIVFICLYGCFKAGKIPSNINKGKIKNE